MDSDANRAACSANRTACRAANPVAVYDEVSQEVLLLFQLRRFGDAWDTSDYDAVGNALGNGLVTSQDGGKTWSEPRDVSADFGAASGSMPGPGAALQLARGGKHGGRLILASHHGAYDRVFVTISDDHGASWRTVSDTFPNMDESALTQLPDGAVLLNMRHQNAPSLGRAFAISSDGGETFGQVKYDAALISPICQASMASFGRATYFANPASKDPNKREHLTIRKSTDNAQSWPSSMLVQAGTAPLAFAPPSIRPASPPMSVVSPANDPTCHRRVPPPAIRAWSTARSTATETTAGCSTRHWTRRLSSCGSRSRSTRNQ